jgi:transcriptional regulator with XRE-family HTH domain
LAFVTLTSRIFFFFNIYFEVGMKKEINRPDNNNPETPNEDELRQRLVRFRKQHIGMDRQSALADALGLNRSKYAHYEKKAKDIPQRVLKKLAEEYGLNIHWLMTGSGEPKVAPGNAGCVTERNVAYSDCLPQKKSHAVFFCYADNDEEIALLLREILIASGLTIHAAQVKHFANGDDGLFDTLRCHIERSDFFVPVFSRHSLDRPLWAFFTGVAAATGKKILPVMVAGMECNIRDYYWSAFPVHFTRYYRLYNMQDVDDLISDMLIAVEGNNGRAQQSDVVKRNIKTVAHHAFLRWCYLAGGLPDNKLCSLEGLLGIVSDLTNALLTHGMSVCAKAENHSLGIMARKSALEWRKQYPVKRENTMAVLPDFEPLLLPSDSSYPDRIHRKNLADKEWFVILGGSEETRREHAMAVSRNVMEKPGIKIFPIPCLGGFGREVFFLMGDSYRRFCDSCAFMEKGLGSNKCPRANEIAAFIKDVYL